MLELLLLAGFAIGAIYFWGQLALSAPAGEEELNEEHQKLVEREEERIFKRRVEELTATGIQLFIKGINQENIPHSLRSIIISKFRSHNEWNTILHLTNIPTEEVQSRLEREATDKVRGIVNQIRDYLPPVSMIAVGGSKTWGSYKNDFWRTSETIWGARYAVGDKFAQSIEDIPIAVDLPSRSRIGGHMIMAPPDHGKTTCMEGMIMDDVQSGAAVVVMDSQQGMIERLLRTLPEDRLIYLDAGALRHPLALSAFNLGRTDRIDDEVKITRALDMFENMFSAMDFAFTANQSILFRELCRFLTAIPQSTLQTASDILVNGYLPYAQYLGLVSENTSSFVVNHLGPTVKRNQQGDYGPTRREVERRIRALSGIPAISRMFNAPTRKVDFSEALRKQKVILINTAQSEISPSGATFFGRYCIMQLALEILARTETNDPIKRVHFYIDEAQEYFSSSDILSLLLEQGRKRGLCLVMAFHHLGQLNKAAAGLSDTIRALTSIKYIKASNGADARAIAGDIQADPTELMNVRKHHFFVHVRDAGNAIFAIPNSADKIKPRRSKEEVQALKKRMHKRFSYDPHETSPMELNPKRSSRPTIDPDAPQNLD